MKEIKIPGMATNEVVGSAPYEEPKVVVLAFEPEDVSIGSGGGDGSDIGDW